MYHQPTFPCGSCAPFLEWSIRSIFTFVDRYLGTRPRCLCTLSFLRFPQLFLIVAGILIQLRVIQHILALTEIFLEAPRLAALIRLWLAVARTALNLEL